MSEACPTRTRIKAVFFDMDDTLFDFTASVRRALLKVKTEYGQVFSDPIDSLLDEYMRILHELHGGVITGRQTLADARLERFRRMLAARGLASDTNLLGPIERCYREEYFRRADPVPGALEVVARLAEHVRVAVLTNHVRRDQLAKIDQLGFSPYLSDLITADMIGTTKPDRRMFETALERLNVQPSEAVMVGDSWPFDVLGACEVGLQAVWFNRTGAECPAGERAAVLLNYRPVEAAVRLLLGFE